MKLRRCLVRLTGRRLRQLSAPLGALGILAAASGVVHAHEITNVTATTYDVTADAQPINHYDSKTVNFSCPSGGVAHDQLDDPLVTNLSTYGVSMFSAYIGPTHSASISFTNWTAWGGDQVIKYRVTCEGTPPAAAPAPQPTKGAITVDATTADGQPYIAGSVANQKVLVSFTCASAPTPFLMTGGAFGDGHGQYISSGAGCTDNAGNAVAPISFGPINVDTGAQPLTVNDTDASIRYSGTGWAHYVNRGVDDSGDDVHATSTNGDSVSYTFTGTGISYITERSVDEGKVDVAIDGVLQQTVDAHSTDHNLANQPLFSLWGLPKGQHTIALTKRDGGYMLLDGFVVQTAGKTINDSDSAVRYTGSGAPSVVDQHRLVTSTTTSTRRRTTAIRRRTSSTAPALPM